MSAGLATDSIGGSRAQRNYTNAERGMRSVTQEADRQNKSLGMLHSRWAMLGGAVLAATPALTQGLGVLVQLTGTLVRAAGGAGVVGGGALGAAVIGFGSLLAVVKPMATEIKKSDQALDHYNQVVSIYGVRSKQAATAAKALNAELKLAPAGTRRFLTDVQGLEKAWSKQIRPAQGSILGLLTYGIDRTRGALPGLSSMVNANVASIAGGGRSIIDRLFDTETVSNVRAISSSFRQMMPDISRIASDAIVISLRLVREAQPFVRGMTRDLRQWADHFDRSTQDVTYMSSRFSRWTADFKDWLKFLGATKNVFSALFGSATGGERELAGITRHFNEWAQWIRTNPVIMERFWRNSVGFAQGLGNALMYVSKLLFAVAAAVTPVDKVLTRMLAALGPEFLVTLNQIAKLFSVVFGGFGGWAGPLSTFLSMLNQVLIGVNHMLSVVPGLGFAVSAAFAVYGIIQFSQWIGTATARMFGLTRATNAQAVAQERAMVAGGGSVGRAALGAYPFIGGISRPGVASAFGAVEGATLQSSQFAMETAPFGLGLSAGRSATGGLAGLYAGLGAGGAARAGLGRAAGAASRFALPLMLALGAFGTLGYKPWGSTSNRANGYIQQFGHSATLGLIPAPLASPNDRMLRSIQQGGTVNYGGHAQGFWESINPFSHQNLHNGVSLSAQARGDYNVGERTFTGVGLNNILAASGGSNPQGLHQIGTQISAYTRALVQARALSGSAAAAFRSEIRSNLSVLQTARNGLLSQRNHADFMKSSNFLAQLGPAYNVINAKQGPVSAMQFVVDQSVRKFKTLGPRGKREMQMALLEWAKEMKDRNPALASVFDDLMNSIIGKYDDVNKHIQFAGRKALTGTTSEWRAIAASMTNPIEKAREQVTADFTIIQQRAVGSLRAMGFSSQQASAIVAGLESGSAASSSLVGAIGRGAVSAGGVNSPHATGGRLAGRGLSDSLHLGGGNLAAPGELVVNRHTEQAVNSLLGPYGMSLGGMVGQEKRPHSATRRFALGGTLGQMYPGASGMPGVPGLMVDQTGLMVSAAISQRLKGIMRGGQRNATAGMVSSAGLGGGTSSSAQKMGYQMMLAMGWPASEWPFLKALWNQESGWNSYAVNPSSGAYGIPQALGHGNVYSLGDTRSQIRWGLNYISGRYGSPGGAWAHEKAVNWYGNGADFIANRPQVIGVGDKRERVKITPTSRLRKTTFSGMPMLHVPVSIGQIVYTKRGDIKKVVQTEVQEAMIAVAREIRNTGLAPEEDEYGG